MSRIARFLTLALVLAAASTLTLSAWSDTGTRAQAAAAAQAAVPAGNDFATAVFHDPWDYSNRSDVLLDYGPSQGLLHPSMSGGGLSFGITSAGGYLSPLWDGYSNEVAMGRGGAVAGNAIDAATYNRMHLHIYASSGTAAALLWTPCAPLTSACMGRMSFTIRAGWNDIDLPIVRSRATGRAWTGRIKGLRLGLAAAYGSSSLRIDSLRIYQASKTSAFTWSAPGTSPATLWWTDTPAPITATLSQHAGRVSNAVASPNRSTRVSANVAGYAPRRYFWAVAANGAKSYIGQTAARPLPIVDTPSAAGCSDYATRALGHPWTFTSGASMASHANATDFSFNAAGVMSATNAGPHRNDPNISLPLGSRGIDGRVYHRLTIVESYDGRFDLRDAPGGGTHARILWQLPGYAALSQTAPLVTYSGTRTLTLDLAMPVSQLTDRSGTAGQRYPFASASRVTRLRYDPNEDPGARRWHLMSVKLAADCQAASSTTVVWHDTQYSAGSTVVIKARSSAGSFYTLGTATERSGRNSKVVSVRSLPVGRYSVGVYVTNTAGITASMLSSGPLVIKR